MAETSQIIPGKGGIKNDRLDDKLRWELVPMDAIAKIADILTYGAKKYGANNWQNLDEFEDRYYAALLRHLIAWRNGEAIDPESGRLHLSHAATNAIFLLWYQLHKTTTQK